MYMMWMDLDPKKSMDIKIKEALAYYRRQHGEPSVILVRPGTEVKTDHGVPVREDEQGMVRANYVYVGHDKKETTNAR